VVTVVVSVVGVIVVDFGVELFVVEGFTDFVVAFGDAFGVDRVVDGFALGLGVAAGWSICLEPFLVTAPSEVVPESVGVASGAAAGACAVVERATAAAGITTTAANTKIWRRTVKREANRSARLRRRFGGRVIGGSDAPCSSP
jgi:cytochrome c biogenesis protein CcdA